MLRRSPRFKNASSDPSAPSMASSPGSDLTPRVEKDFPPLLWQTSIQELSEHEIRFPIPQPAPRTYDVVASGDHRVAIFANWKDLLRR